MKGRIRWAGQVTAVGVAQLRSYDQYGTEEHAQQANHTDFVGNALNAVVGTTWQGADYPRGEEKVFLTSLGIARPVDVRDHYDLRSLIENTAFRELKQGWCLESYPKKTEAAVRGHVFLTLVAFTLANAFRTAQGQTLARHGLRRQRAQEECGKVVAFAGDLYALFDLEEVLVLRGGAALVFSDCPRPSEVSLCPFLGRLVLLVQFQVSGRPKMHQKSERSSEGLGYWD
jgi:hypothetical protein